MSFANPPLPAAWPKWLAAGALLLLALPPYPAAFHAAALLAALAGIAALFLPAPLLWLGAPLPPERFSARARACWPVAGCVLLIGMLAFLEMRQPLYFVQDDNHSQFLPILLDALRHGFAEGKIPTWNAYQAFGYPLVGTGVYALTYPPTWIAYGIARLLGQPAAMLDIFAFMHLLAGYALFYAVLRKAGLRPALAASASFCFALNGFNLIYGRSWYIVLPLAFFLPALVGSVLAFGRGQAAGRWAVWSGLAMGAWFHSGHAQIWVYGMVFWGLGLGATILLRPGLRLRMALLAASAACLALAVAMPLLYIQYIEQTRFSRPVWVYGDGIFNALPAVLLPLSLPPPVHFSLAFFCNTLFFAGFLLALALGIAGLAKHAPRRALLLAQLPTALALLALLWAMGDRGLLWKWMSVLPPFNRFNDPCKLVPFVIAFSLLAGGLWWERLGRGFRLPAPALPALAACAMALSAWHTSRCTLSRYDFADHPYPALRLAPMHFSAGAASGRVLSLAANHSRGKNLTYALVNNYASVYGIFSANGYGDFITQSFINRRYAALAWRDPARYLQAYGITGVIVGRLGPGEYSRYNADPPVRLAYRFAPRGPKYALLPTRTAGTKPLVYAENADGSPVALPFRVLGDGLAIALPDTGMHNVTANFLCRDWFRASAADGTPLPISADAFGRIRVEARGTRGVLIRYALPWGPACAAGLALLAGAVLLWQASRRMKTA